MKPAMQPGNWGRWGSTDERGAANLITPDSVCQAVSTVKAGRIYQLGLPIKSGRQLVAARPAAQHYMTLDGGDFAAGVSFASGTYQAADDHLSLPCHTGTHVDALAHVWYDHQLFNGFPGSAVRSYGATKCGIENLGCIVTRGVLLDVARAAGLERLDARHEITPADLEACPGASAVTPGSAILIRTGWLESVIALPPPLPTESPGIGLPAARWLAAKDAVIVGADNIAVEKTMGAHRYANDSQSPECHKLLIRDHGVYLLEMVWLAELASTEAKEFLFVLVALPIVGGTGSPVNPVAIM